MIKKPFLIFTLVMSTLIACVILFIQSATFAFLLKKVAVFYLPQDLGVQADFSEVSIQLFPPGFVLHRPQIRLSKKNALRLSEASSITAEKMRFSFRPFQALSGDIRIHAVTIERGVIRGKLTAELLKKNPQPTPVHSGLHWDALFQIHAESVILKDVQLELQWDEIEHFLSAHVDSLEFAQWSGQGGLGYQLLLDTKKISGQALTWLQFPSTLEVLRTESYLNARGLRIESGMIQFPGLQLGASGEIHGNFLSFGELMADLQIKASGNFEELLKTYRSSRPQLRITRRIKNTGATQAPSARDSGPRDLRQGDFQWTQELASLQGSFLWEGSIRGRLDKNLDTLQAAGLWTGKNLAWQGWFADSFEAHLQWNYTPSGGRFSLKKGILAADQKPRWGGFQPGRGGRIEFGPTVWEVGSQTAVVLPLKFEHAHIHWLAAPVVKKIYPLDFSLNGESQLRWTPRGTTVQVNLGLGPLKLDNQKYQQTRPLRALFSIPHIKLQGKFDIASRGVDAVDIQVLLPHSRLGLQGKVDSKVGYALKFGGGIQLADLHEIAGNEIFGQGNVSGRISGPSSQVIVDLDTDIQNASYLKLLLGHMKGKIIWEDDPQFLRFEQVKFRQKSSDFTLDGFLGFGQKEILQLRADIQQGDIQDLFFIFSPLLDSVPYFPRALNGPMTGNFLIQGGMHLDQLQVTASGVGNQWEYLGERFQSVQLNAGYDRGRYWIENLNATKRSGGQLLGAFAFKPGQEWSWNIHTQNFFLTDFDRIAQLDVPVRGRLQLDSYGSGPWGTLDSHTSIHVHEARVQGQWLPASSLAIKTHQGVWKLDGNLFGSEGLLDLKYDPHSKSHVHCVLKDLDFSPMLLMLNPKGEGGGQYSAKGVISGALDLSFQNGNFSQSDGSLNLSQYFLSRTDHLFSLANPVSLKITQGSFDTGSVLLRGKPGELSVRLKSQDTQLEGSVRGKVDAAFIEFFTPSVYQISGTTGLNFLIGGTWEAPTWVGRIDLENTSFKIPSLESAFENGNGVIQVRQKRWHLQSFQTDVGGGRLAAEGHLVVHGDRYPELNLHGTLKGAKLKIYPFQYLKLNSSLQVSGMAPPYGVQGKVLVDSGLSKEKVLNRSRGSSELKSLHYAPPSPLRDTRSAWFKLKVDVDVPSRLMLQNDLFRNVQLKGNFTLVNTLDAPRVLGTAEVLQGQILFKGHAFQIQSGKAHFDSPRTMNPSFDLNANTELNGIKIQMYASGRAEKEKMKIAFTSNPPLAEPEILSLLTLGITSADAKKLNASDLSLVQQGEAASLVLHSLDFNRDVEDKTGFQIQVDESVNDRQGVSAFRPQSQSEAMAAPQITIRRQLGNRLSLSAGSTVGVGTNRSNQVNLDFSVNPGVSVTGVLNNYATYGTTADTQTTQQNSLGLDLKFQKRFR